MQNKCCRHICNEPKYDREMLICNCTKYKLLAIDIHLLIL
nr:MAG TPA: hypothetical protein [Inoviridae sp.]